MFRKLITKLDEQLRSQKSNTASKTHGGKSARELDVLALEERILYSAVPMVQAAEAPPDAGLDSTALNSTNEAANSSNAGSEPAVADADSFWQTHDQSGQSTINSSTATDANEIGWDGANASAVDVTRELIFIDSSVDDFQQLLNNIVAQGDPSRQIEVVFVDPTRDGIEQISQTLAGRTNIAAIHIVTQGNESQVQLGSSVLNNESLASNSSKIANWASSLAADSELLFYGCDLANDDGQLLVDSLAALCDCDVAASQRPTEARIGAAALDTAEGQSSEVVFIQAGLADRDALIADLQQNALDSGRSISVVVLNGTENGFDQVDATLARYTNLNAIHFVSHGAEGMIQLGGSWLTAGNVQQHLGDLQRWGMALSEAGDILIYGCDVAAGAEGQALIDTVARVTSADVAASTDRTGDLSRGGNWSLEYVAANPSPPAPLPRGGEGSQYTNEISPLAPYSGRGAGGEGLESHTVNLQPPVSSLQPAIQTQIAFGLHFQESYGGLLAVYTVTNTNDSGAGSLRQAILDANALGGTDTISFNISTADAGYIDPTPGAPGSGDEYWRIQYTSFLGFITDPVILDARTQPGYSGTPVIALDGSLSSFATAGLVLRTNNSLIAGFSVYNSPDEGIEIDGSTGFGDYNTLLNNWIGIDPTGLLHGNVQSGLLVAVDADGNQIGGIGLNDGNVIAGTTAFAGVTIRDSDNNILEGNFIGVAADGVTPLGNASHGIQIDTSSANNLIGGTAANAANIIAHNTSAGVALFSDAGAGNAVLSNSIYSNTGLGIDIAADGVTNNDSNDGDIGANNLQNYPLLTSVAVDGTSVIIAGSLNGESSTSYRIEFFANSTNDREGQRYLGFTTVTTPASGPFTANFTATFTASIAAGEYITATATDPWNNSSEFSAQFVAFNGMGIWANNNTTPGFAQWTGTSFGSNSSSATTGEWAIMQVAEAPTRHEIIAVGVDTAGVINGQIWNGSTWTAFSFNDLVNLSTTGFRSFQLAYEQQSGDALLVWDNGSTGSTSLSYRTWNGTTWSSAQTITTPVTGEAVELRLAADPNSDSMILAVSGTPAANDYAFVWNGSSWGNSITLDTSVGLDRTEVNVAYESHTGRAIVVYDADSTTNAINYRIWDGTTWGSQLSLSAPAGIGPSNDANYSIIASDPGSNRIALAVVTDGSDIWVSVWDGSAWTSQVAATTTAAITTAPVVGLAFEHDSGDLLAAYGKSGNSNVLYRTWSSASGWSAELTGPAIGSVPNSVVLNADPNSDRIMLGTHDAGSDINYAEWTGSTWNAVSGDMTSDTGTTGGFEPLGFVWYDNNRTPVISTTGLSMGENNTAAGTIASNDADGDTRTYTVIGGADQALFTIHSTTGALSFIAAPDSETPTDTGADNVYDVIIRVSDGTGGTDSQAIAVTVTNGNDAPVNTVPGVQFVNEDSALSFTVGNSNAISIADGDAGTSSVQVTLAVTNGSLSLSGVSGLTFSTGDGNSDTTMMFTGTTTNINLALAGLSFTPTANFSGSSTLTITTNDLGNSGSGGAQSDVDNIVITVNAVNDAPEVTTSGSTLAYTENATTVVDPGLMITDVDGAIAGATITISTGYINGQDVLAFTNQLGISGSWDATSGILTLSGTTTVANYQTALRSVTYSNTSDTPNTGARAITFVVNDGTDSSTAGIQTTFISATFASNSDGFAYVDDAFGTIDPTKADGTYVAAGGFTDGGLQVYLTAGPNTSAVSGGWSNTFNTATAGEVAVTFRFRMNMGEGFETDEYGEVVLTVDGTRYGSDTNNSVLRMTGNNNGGGTESSGWQQTTVKMNLSAGAHTLVIGAFGNKSTLSDEWIELVVDDVTVGQTSSVRDLSVTPVNDQAAFTGLDGTPTFTEAGAAVVLDSNVTIFDAELSAADDLSGATLTVTRNGGANSQDVFSATGTLGTLTQGGSLVVGGTTIGTVTTNSSGTLELTFNSNATNTLVNSVMQQIAYSNNSSTPPASAQIDWTFNDNNAGTQGTGGALTAVGSIVVTITTANEVPVLDTSMNPTMSSINEDAGAPVGAVGTLVSALVDFATPSGQVDNVTDGDSGPSLGIAVISANTTYGTWYYSIDNGNNWNLLGSVGPSSARLLAADANTRVYMQPDADVAVTVGAGISFRAWDQTGGSNGTLADTSINGGTSAFSVNFDQVTLTISPINDAPLLDNAGNMTLTTITENQTSNSGQTVASIVSSAGGDRITDVDSGAIEGIAITATTNGNGSWEYSLNGSTWLAVGSVANNSALLLRSSDFLRFVPNGQDATTGDITFRAWDQTGATSGQQGTKVDVSTNGGTTAFSWTTEVSSINVSAVNDAPFQNSIEATVLGFTENAGPVAITSSLTVADWDDTNIESAVVAITANYMNSQDVLAFTNQNGITGSWSATNGTLTLSGSATLAHYEAALRSITYTNSSDSPSTATRTVSFTVNDGDANSNLQSRDIVVTAVNDAPVVVDKLAAMLASQTINVATANGLLFDAWDFEGNPLTAVLIAGPASGSLTVNSDGSWSYAAATGFYGDVTFTYAANDGSAISSAATVTIQVSIGGIFLPTSSTDPDKQNELDRVLVTPRSILESESTTGNFKATSAHPGTTEEVLNIHPKVPEQKSATSAKEYFEDEELLLEGFELTSIRFKPNSQKQLISPEYTEQSARMNFVLDNSDLLFSLDQFRSLDDERQATLNLVSGAVTTLFVGASAGIAAWCVGGSYLFSIVASSLPTWSGFDVIHIVNNPIRIKGDDDKSVAQMIVSGLQSESK